MGLLDFIDTTFILTLGVVLLICGGIMIYCYRRLNVLENGLIQQGRVMQEFISNYNLTSQMNMQNNMCGGMGSCPFVDKITLENTGTQEILNNSEKILVSDDDDDDDDDEVIIIEGGSYN